MSGRRWAAAAAAAIAACSLLLVYDHTRGDSLSADEPVHILAGHLQVSARTAIVNIEHPPLAKVLAGLGLLPLSLPAAPERIPMGGAFTDWGHAFLFENRISPDSIAAAARAPFLLLLALLLALLFFATRARYGNGPALFATALLAFDPNFVAHAGVVHTDLAAALGFFAAVLAWDRCRRGETLFRLAIAAGALGLAFCSKFSAVYLLPILLVQILLAARTSPEPGREAARLLGRLALVGAGALLVVFALYAGVTSRMDREDQQRVIHEMVAGRGAPRLSSAIEALARFSPPLGHFAGGLASVARQNAVGGGVNYFFGKASVEGFPLYFPAAFLFKSSLAFLLATAVALIGAVRYRLRTEGALFLLPVALLFLASMGSSYNIGIRHLLPVYPLLAMAAAASLARIRDRKSRLVPLLLLGVPLLAAAETLRIHPHELSYFNALAGGPERGRRILSDSNVDWGLDLRRLASELARRGERDPTIVYFGGDDVLYRTGVPDFSADSRRRSTLVAISAFHLAVGPFFYAYHGASGVATALERLRSEIRSRGRPAGRVGYSIYLFELPPG